MQVKVNSVYEACANYFAVQIIRIWNLANHMKKQNKTHQNASFIDEKLKTNSRMFFISFFFMWFAQFQILICEPQSIWPTLLLLSLLYIQFLPGWSMKSRLLLYYSALSWLLRGVSLNQFQWTPCAALAKQPVQQSRQQVLSFRFKFLSTYSLQTDKYKSKKVVGKVL